jgi:hypothetical protein
MVAGCNCGHWMMTWIHECAEGTFKTNSPWVIRTIDGDASQRHAKHAVAKQRMKV